MSTRLTSAIVLGLALVAGPINPSAASASGLVGLVVEADAAAAATIASDIQAAVQAAIAKVINDAPLVGGKKDTAAFAKLTPEAKAAIINAAVLEVLAASGATAETQAAALIAAVKLGAISAGTAVSLAGIVAPQFSAMVSADPAIQAGLKGEGLTTASTTVNGQTISVLTGLNAPQGPAGTPVAPAAYDPCAGVVAAYCG